MINQKNLEYVYDDGEVLFLTDSTNYYGLNYNDIDKSELIEYANLEPSEVEKGWVGGNFWNFRRVH